MSVSAPVQRGLWAAAVLGLFTHRSLAAQSAPPPGESAGVPRDVRVLLGDDVGRVRIRGETPIDVRDEADRKLGVLPASEDVIARPGSDGNIYLAEEGLVGGRIVLRGSAQSPLSLALERDGEWSGEVKYPGAIRLRGGDTGRLEVVNAVELEAYVACVVANEVWPTFETEAFRGQAVVTRTFVLYQMTRRPDAPHDVYATQGSQVYRGLRDDPVGRKAAQAAQYTRGIVLTFDDRGEDRLFCAYFSAACGGLSQSAKLLGPEGDVEPLRGGVRCDYCRIAPGDTYRWGPVRIGLSDLTNRLLERYPELDSLGVVAGIAAGEQTRAGRLVTLRLTGSTGATHEMLAERFRLAVGPSVIRSTDCRVRVEAGEAVFDNGKGFGHGLGLCQWGMQGQALAGKQAADILRFYYPGTKLTRAY
jgi:stage II sporulation protein D